MLISQLTIKQIDEMIAEHRAAKGEHSEAIKYLQQLKKAKLKSRKANGKFERFLFKEMDNYSE